MLVVIATKNELPLVEKFGYGDKQILITGVGGVNIIKALKDIPKDTYIVNIGYAGSNSISVGEQIEVGYVSTYHENVNFVEYQKYLTGNVDCYTSTDFVTHTNIKQPCVFDMELAFICAMFDNVKSIKVVSDNLSLEEYSKKIKLS